MSVGNALVLHSVEGGGSFHDFIVVRWPVVD